MRLNSISSINSKYETNTNMLSYSKIYFNYLGKYDQHANDLVKRLTFHF